MVVLLKKQRMHARPTVKLNGTPTQMRGMEWGDDGGKDPGEELLGAHLQSK